MTLTPHAEPTHWVFWFMHHSEPKSFGPYENWTQASEAFQRAYGYWPEHLIEAAPWESAR